MRAVQFNDLSMIATLLPSPTLMSVFEDLRRSILEAINSGRARRTAKRREAMDRDYGIARALGRLSIAMAVPLIFRDALAKRRGSIAQVSEALDFRQEDRAGAEPAVVATALPRIPDEIIWERATLPIVEAQTAAREAFTLHAEAGEHIDAATYALDGLLGELKAVMPGIKMRTAKLHKMQARADRKPAKPMAVEDRAPLRGTRAA